MACPATAAMPLVTRDEVLSVIPATLAEPDLVSCLAAAEAAAIVGLGRHITKVNGSWRNSAGSPAPCASSTRACRTSAYDL